MRALVVWFLAVAAFSVSARAQIPPDAVAIATGAHSACVLDAQRVPWCWGMVVWDGQAHDRQSLNPRAIGGEPVDKIAVSDGAICVLRDGEVWCRGRALGRDTKRVTGIDDAVDLAVDGRGGCLRRAKGAVWCWNAAGTRVERVFGRERDAEMARHQAPEGFGCDFTAGQVVCTGHNHMRQLGVAHRVALFEATAVSALGGELPQAEATATPSWAASHPLRQVLLGRQDGKRFACVLDQRGLVACQGARFTRPPINTVSGAIRMTASADEVSVIDDLTGAVAISGRGAHVCALLSNDIRCTWGGYVRPFMGWPADHLAPGREWGFRSSEALVRIAAGENHVCTMTGDGRVLCAGDNRWGQLGRTSGPQLEALGEVPGLPFITALWAGPRSTCAQSDDGVWCWGLIEDWTPDAVPEGAQVESK